MGYLRRDVKCFQKAGGCVIPGSHAQRVFKTEKSDKQSKFLMIIRKMRTKN